MTTQPTPFFVRAFIHRFDMICWKCGAETPVLYAFRPPNNLMESEFNPDWIGAYEVNPDQDPAMGEALAERFTWYRLGYSHTMGGQVHASFCTSCDSLQGNWYVWKDLLYQLSSGEQPDFDEQVDYTTNHDAEEFLHGDGE